METQNNANTPNPAQEEEKKKKRRFIIIIIILLFLLCICASATLTMWLSAPKIRDKNNANGPQHGAVVLEPDYAELPQESHAVQIEGEDPSEGKLEAPQGGGSVALVYSDQVTIALASNKVGLYYQNPSRSTQNVVVQVIVDGAGEDRYLIAQSGVLEPGFMVTSLDVSPDSIVSLSAGVYSGRLKILFYDPETGERAIVDTDIPVSITVRDE